MNRGDWMQTISGGRFYPSEPCPDGVLIEDIAHALSNQCRFAGHVRRFYSVAEHSVHVSYCVPQEHALQALMHDATEAYLVDVPRPAKVALTDYKRLEDKAWAVIAEVFRVPYEMHPSVKRADDAVLMAEKEVLLKRATWTLNVEPANVRIRAHWPFVAKHLFLRRFRELTGKQTLIDKITKWII